MIIKSYIVSGIRSFLKNKITSFINIIGLASTIAIGLAVFLIVDKQLSLDEFHENPERIYTIQSVINWDRSEQIWARAPQLLGPTLAKEVPSIESMTRVQIKTVTVRTEDRMFSERLTFVDDDFFKVFNFPLTYGTTRSLAKRDNEVILSTSYVEKYFDKLNPIGQQIRIIVDDKALNFIVVGIADEFPTNASFRFNILLSINHLSTLFDSNPNTWKDVNRNAAFTFVKLNNEQSLGTAQEQTQQYLSTVNASNPDWPIERFHFEPLATAAQNAQYTRECLTCGSTPEVIIMFAVISIILFASACFNYINISIAASSKRLKEIALRKVIGSSRTKIILQFLVENLVLSFFAMVLGLILAKTIIVPGMNSIFGGDPIVLSFLDNPELVVFSIVAFFVVGLCSGAYPAWYISSFKPIEIFRGREQLVGNSSMTKVFLTLQFSLTFIAIVAGLIFTQTNKAQEAQDWGYDQANLIVIPVKNKTQLNTLNQYCNQSTSVTSYCSSHNQIGRSRSSEIVELDYEKSSVDVFYVDHNYIDTYQLSLLSGRPFDKNLVTDFENSAIVNEKFLQSYDWYENVGKTITLNNKKVNIIGVVKDFHHQSFFEPVVPTVLKLSGEENAQYISIKVNDDEMSTVKQELAGLWKESFPDNLYLAFEQSSVFDVFFEQSGQLIDIMNFTAVMAILLSSMGLFGLVSLLIIKRIKELSIRNVLGASRIQIVKIIVHQFSWVLLIAIVFAAPASYFLFDFLLSQMFLGTPAEIDSIPFILTLSIILITMIGTILYHVRILLSSNPVNHLRME